MCYQNDAIRYHRYHTTLFVAVCVSKRVSFCVSKCVSTSALLPIGIREKCHAVSKRFPIAFTVRTRTTSGHLYIIRGTLPRPRCVLCGRTRTRAYVCAHAYMRVWAHARNACACVPMTRVPRAASAPMPMPTRPPMRLSRVAHVRPGMSAYHASRSARHVRATCPAWHVRAAPDTCRLWA